MYDVICDVNNLQNDNKHARDLCFMRDYTSMPLLCLSCFCRLEITSKMCRKSLMADRLGPASQGHEMYCPGACTEIVIRGDPGVEVEENVAKFQKYFFF